MILHGPENVVGAARLVARGQRSTGLDAVSICHTPSSGETGEHQFGAPGHSLWQILKRIVSDVEVLHLYFGRSFTGDDLADAELARALGKPVFMTLLGCDVRNSKRIFSAGEPTMCTSCWPQNCSINRQRTLDFLSTSKTPPLATTPDLLLEVSGGIWLPLPVDMAVWQAPEPKFTHPNKVLRVLHAPTDTGKKGTAHIVAAIEALQKKGCAIELLYPQHLSQSGLKELALTCDVAIDQLMAGVYGTFAAEMMAMGLPTIARLSPSLRHIYPDDLPILSARPDELEDLLLACLDGRVDLRAVGAASKAYARRVHCHYKVAALVSALY